MDYDRTVKISRKNFGGEKKPKGFIYIPGYQFHQAKIDLELKACLHNAVINAAPGIGKFANRNKLYRQFSPRSVKDANMNETKNASCVFSVMTITHVSTIERKKWGSNSIIKQIDDIFYLYTCTVTNIDKNIQHLMHFFK